MEVPLQIHFQNMDPSPAVESAVREGIEKLEGLGEHIISCRVTVEAPHKHHRKGKLYHVMIDVRVPRGEIIASRSPDRNHAHEDVYVALRDALKAVHRQLEDHVRISRGKVKSHEVPPHGRIVALKPRQDYGLIETADGREIYFHRNSITNADFNQLSLGAEVRFNEEMGDQGPQATAVQAIGKHHIVD
jgi:cold shock CspA family protein/ribosome-associated translation inhibitor RaiA